MNNQSQGYAGVTFHLSTASTTITTNMYKEKTTYAKTQ